MTEIIKRLLSRVPLLLVTTLILFALFANLKQKEPLVGLPTFINPTPLSAQRSCELAFNALLEQDIAHQPSLEQLGGTCLPQLLPRLRKLRLQERRKLALALWPIAQRMGLAQRNIFLPAPNKPPLTQAAKGQQAGDAAILFWEQFQEDRALDFKVSSAKRLVTRLARGRLSLRKLDLLDIDTYALPTLVNALGRVDTEEDVARIERVSSVISHTLEKDFSLSENASVLEARLLATEIRYFWDQQSRYYTPMNKLELSLGRLNQTRFGIWIARSWRSLTAQDTGITREKVWRFTLLSLPLLLIAAAASLLIAPLIVGASQLIFLGRRSWQRGWLIRIFWAVLSAVSLVLLLHSTELFFMREELVIAFIAVSWTSFILQREVADRIDWRVHQVLRTRPVLRRIETVARWLGPTIPTFAPLFASQWVVWVMCAEYTGARDGWGYRTLFALKEGDIPWLMTSSLGLTLVALGVQTISDLIVGRGNNQNGASL